MFYFRQNGGIRVSESVVYREDMPKGTIVKLVPENVILVGTGSNNLKGVEQNEGVLPQTRR